MNESARGILGWSGKATRRQNPAPAGFSGIGLKRGRPISERQLDNEGKILLT